MIPVLVVDSDGKALAGLQRQLRKGFETHMALGPRLGLRRMEEDGPYSVVVAEFSMPEMDGVDFLARVRERWPDCVRILLSRVPMDVSDLLRAINDAKVYHLLSASCDEATLAGVVARGMEKHSRLAASTRNMHETGAVFAKSVHEIVCWLHGGVQGMISPILPVLRDLGHELDMEPVLAETALLMSVMGLVVLPAGLLGKILEGRELSDEEKGVLAGHPERPVELIRHLPQMREVSAILNGYADKLRLLLSIPATQGEQPTVPAEAALLAMVMEYRLALFEKLDNARILERMRSRGVHAPALIDALEAVLSRMDRTETTVTLGDLQPGMVLARSVTGVRDGAEVILAPEGYELSRTTIAFLRQTARHGQVREPIYVRGGFTPPADSGSA
jgi:CheY-like chemotaxis protein